MKRRIPYILIFLCAAWSATNAQVEARQPKEGTDVPEFFIDALGFASSDSAHSRLDVFIHVPYGSLRFTAMNPGYKARYEVTVNIFTEKNVVVAEKTWGEEVHHEQYEETEKRSAYSLTQRSFHLLPGTYILRAQVHDDESKKIATVVKKIVIETYDGTALTMSDVMLISRITSEKGRMNIVPNIMGTVAEGVDGLYVFFEVYASGVADTAECLYAISTAKSGNIFTRRVLHVLTGGKTQIIEKLDTAKFASGVYTVSVEVRLIKPGAGGTVQRVLKEKKFIARWGAIPLTITDLDLAIRQTHYIAKNSEYNDMEDATTNEEKQKLFEAFWRRRDPSPDTKRNEFMEEYYSRVEYANEHFAHYLAGWKTDMGMVFILLGSPNNVERHPFDIDSKPYEVWSYYDYNRTVVFVDETGFGDYRLLTPIYDLLQRAK